MTEMSTTKAPMLSTTHAIFRGLQDNIKEILRSLPNSVSPGIKLGLMDAHRKLSDYYYKYDASPFYIWAACKWGFVETISFLIMSTKCLIHASLIKAWRWIMATIKLFPITLKSRGQTYSPTLTKITPFTTQHHHCRLLPLSRHHLLMARLRSPSRLDIAERWITLLTNWKSISNSQPKISNPATQSNGGWVDEANSRASFSWCVTFYAFLVC